MDFSMHGSSTGVSKNRPASESVIFRLDHLLWDNFALQSEAFCISQATMTVAS